MTINADEYPVIQGSMPKSGALRRGKSEAWYCICPVVSRKGEPAFSVAVKRHGCKVGKYFTVSKYENEAAALEAAQAWRDAVLALLPPMTRKQLRIQPRKNNQSGIPGVFCSTPTAKRSTCWIASVEEGSEKCSKKYTASFSIKRYGEEQAKALAIAAHNKFLEKIEDGFNLYTESGDAIARRRFGSAADMEATLHPTIVDASAKAAFMQRLRDAGLIGKQTPPPVRRRQYGSMASPVWETSIVLPNGNRKTRRFSVSAYGEAQAKWLAKQAYAQLQQELGAPKQSRKSSENDLWIAEKLVKYPNEVLDVAQQLFKCKSDAALSQFLGITPPAISKFRHHALPIGATAIMGILEGVPIPIKDLYKAVIEKHRASVHDKKVDKAMHRVQTHTVDRQRDVIVT